ncbi:DNA polymerase III subunit epsilon [Ursidibacter maritimus]|uniref:DNA polymerase III subunit epsilon n=1 Tax=Ursidibacter maritimus TaxID=1331689 RepID=A0A949WF91_9PAST|nr:DNA polymerase III subunit epsilon [Ursidibacter maritimus]KAE9538743.1 DNA polymerase III subunit epsilon [Ursidibacter maritimus]MBV6523364.1 DNA polymerase III subunit epsilon [Ursidibacter maritimus]MBV6526439.1 DNA polymerase III subunit epsilon [Ursidibacter maritimus]MBV6527770.1 DNA polymerase III subunit epsilon [Ursidibacter maritimus]MBV6529791.1 DNA polymerase III subunit epsilon [Ursidibacter maritimus]
MSEQPILRQVVLDTETTGMNFNGAPHIGHNIIEIGAVEVINRRLTGKTYHVYIKPPREVEEEAIKVHGITNEMLVDKPTFAEIADEFLEFIKGAELIIHNAPFDVGFIDHEFSFLANPPDKVAEMCMVTDSLQLARKMYPGKRNNLDALCDRLGIDNSKRVLHGALLDAEILADVFLVMTGGQIALLADEETEANTIGSDNNFEHKAINSEGLIVLQPSEEEQQAHLDYLKLLDKKSKGNCLWTKIAIDDDTSIN